MNSNDLLLMGVNGVGTFTVTNNLPDSIDQGYFDAKQNWVSTGSASYTNNGNGTFTVNVGSSDFRCLIISRKRGRLLEASFKCEG